MANYILVDVSNLFFRCRHATQGDTFTRAGMSLHIMFRSMRKVWRDFAGDHVVFCLDGGSWRGEIYPQYKAHRKLVKLQATSREKEDDEVFMTTLNDFITFITSKTRSSVLRCPGVEADDFIARWIQLHPDDRHIILSGDSDFVQLLADNVTIYDGVKDHTITTRGVADHKGQPLEFAIKSDSKLRVGKPTTEPAVEDRWWERALFTKIVRGDASDNIASAYPKVRETRLREAYDDRATQGYAWNNFMLQTWTNPEGQPVRVLDAYHENEALINLTMQPEHVKARMDEAIVAAVQRPPVANVGIHFLRFCEQNALINLSKEAIDHATYLNAAYAK